MGLKLQGSRLRGLRILSRLGGRQETDGGIVYKQIRINAKLQIGKRGQKTELTGRSPLRRRRSALDYNATEEEEEEDMAHDSYYLVAYIYIYIYIQGVPGGKDLTSGECSLGQAIPI